jgi:hypothetical protein
VTAVSFGLGKHLQPELLVGPLGDQEFTALLFQAMLLGNEEGRLLDQSPVGGACFFVFPRPYLFYLFDDGL